MTGEEMERLTNQTRELLASGQVLGIAYFTSPDMEHAVAVGSLKFNEADFGVAFLKLIQIRGFDIERICLAIMALAKKKRGE